MNSSASEILLNASMRGDLQQMRSALQAGANANDAIEAGIGTGQVQAVALLLEAGASALGRSEDGVPHIVSALATNQTHGAQTAKELVELLINTGVDIHKPDASGQTLVGQTRQMLGSDYVSRLLEAAASCSSAQNVQKKPKL